MMKVKTYAILERAVEEGVKYGYTRAFKHVENPTQDHIETEVVRAVMNQISEVFNFDDDFGGGDR